MAVRDRNEIEESVYDFSPKQHRKRKRGNESTNIVIRQEVDTSCDEGVQEERQVGPHIHHEMVEVCAGAVTSVLR